MASQSFKVSSFLALAIIASSLNYGVAQTQTQESKFCNNAKSKDVCNTMVSGATNWNEAIEKAVQSTLTFAKELKSKKDVIAPALAKLPSEKKQSVEETCKESFDTVIDMLEQAQDGIKSTNKDLSLIHTKLSAALDTECVDELSNAGATFPEAQQLADKVSACLAIVALRSAP